MYVKLKRKSKHARDAVRRMFRSPNPEPPAIHLEYTSWDGLEALVRSLNDKPGEFSELASAIDRLSACVKMFDAQCRTRREYSQLRIDMDELFAHLARDLSTPLLLPLHRSHERVARFAGSLDRETEPLLEPKKSPNDEEALATNDLNEVLTSYRRVRTLFALLLLSENTTIWKMNDNKETTARLESFPYAPAAYYRYSGPDAVPRNGCIPGTREAVLQDLRDWVHYGKSQNIRWLNGTAGIGKTAVAYSLCEYLESTGKPFASVFCSRQQLACRDVNRILPTISYQLAQQSLPFRCALSSGLGQDLEVLRLPFDDQFKKLIATPLGLIGHTLIGDPVIVIDGIEECEEKHMIYQLLRTLVEQASKLPIKLLVSILPSRMTHKYMRDTPSERHLFELRLHELNHSYLARNDITTYLAVKLQDLDLSTTDLERLAQRSGASFVYAAALVRYLDEANSAERVERLQWLLGVSDPADPKYLDPGVRYSFVTQAVLHSGVLEDSKRDEILMLLRTIAHKAAPPTLDIAAHILGQDFVCNLQVILSMLLPVLCVSGSDGLGISLETAFATYLLSQSHSDRLYLSPAGAHTQLTRGCFELMISAEPSFNVCDLESSCLLDREVPYLTERANDMISPELFYACLHWGAHMELADMSEGLYSRLEDFLSARILLWIEVLNLKHCLSRGVIVLRSLYKWLQQSEPTAKLMRLVEDACEFASVFCTDPISQSTPHIYVSGLQFLSRPGPILECYRRRLRSLTDVTEEWPARQMRANTSYNSSVRPLETPSTATETGINNSSNRRLEGNIARPLAGHTDWVYSVAYSPDGAYIASGSRDRTIRIWGARTGKPVGQPLTGHTRDVRSVVYSPDGAYIASGSDDMSIRIWNAHTGEPVGQPLASHRHFVSSVAYSPDGAYIVSGSHDKTIRIWDAHTGKPVGQPLTRHTDYILSVVYSPDSAYIASGSADSTICIWDALTGKSVGQPLTGHTGSVYSVTYSPDGAYVASGSSDKTIRIWDARTGKLVGQPLTGHTRDVRSVVYSPDGAYIASGSDDHTISIWDAHTGKPVARPLTSQISSVYSVSYSPSGAYIVFGSYDGSVRVWFAPTRPEFEPVQPPTSSRYPAIKPPRRSFWAIHTFTNRTTQTTRLKHSHQSSNLLKQQDTIGTSITASPYDWTLNEDGWVLGPGRERLLWVPRNLWDKVAPPGVKMILYWNELRNIGLDFREAKLGLDWQQCYDPS
ncbi:hypothetical protein FRC12_025161 [Ceratobasidium sp. 428]|nr:hypothetical protein FRC12_025161 [Ceratobasidium sp. 428]